MSSGPGRFRPISRRAGALGSEKISMSGVATTFLDTNILVYARDRSELSKGPFAERLL